MLQVIYEEILLELVVGYGIIFCVCKFEQLVCIDGLIID